MSDRPTKIKILYGSRSLSRVIGTAKITLIYCIRFLSPLTKRRLLIKMNLFRVCFKLLNSNRVSQLWEHWHKLPVSEDKVSQAHGQRSSTNYLYEGILPQRARQSSPPTETKFYGILPAQEENLTFGQRTVKSFLIAVSVIHKRTRNLRWRGERDFCYCTWKYKHN